LVIGWGFRGRRI